MNDLQEKQYLKVVKKYRGLDFLCATENGDLYILPHCTNKRTVFFTKIKPFTNNGYKSIKYKKRNVSFKKLKSLAYDHVEFIALTQPR